MFFNLNCQQAKPMLLQIDFKEKEAQEPKEGTSL
jgi:hypothetical protein